MAPTPKRRARFKRGVTPPLLEKVEEKKAPALSWWQQDEQRRKEREERQKERIRNRKPLPDSKAISESFLESTLRCFALADPEFWEISSHRWFHYPSDFMGKLRLGQHLDSYERVLAVCKKVKFPTLKHGRIEVTYGDDSSDSRKAPKITFHLAETSEWKEAQNELRAYLEMGEVKEGPNPKVQAFVDFANSVDPGKEVEVPRELYQSWNYSHRSKAVRLAQRIDPRLYEEHLDHWNVRIVVAAGPNLLLSVPSLDLPLNLPDKTTKADIDKASRRIEDLIKSEVQKSHANDAGLVLARTTSRIQARRLFGHLQPKTLAEVCSKLRPVGMIVWWDFPEGNMPWVFGVYPNKDLSWKDVVAEIDVEACKIPSSEKYGLSKEAAALFDWLRSLSDNKFTWNLAPALSESLLEIEIGLKNPWSRENGFLFFQLLTEEITRKTEFAAMARSWHGDYLTQPVRIEFRKK